MIFSVSGGTFYMPRFFLSNNSEDNQHNHRDTGTFSQLSTCVVIENIVLGVFSEWDLMVFVL